MPPPPSNFYKRKMQTETTELLDMHTVMTKAKMMSVRVLIRMWGTWNVTVTLETCCHLAICTGYVWYKNEIPYPQKATCR